MTQEGAPKMPELPKFGDMGSPDGRTGEVKHVMEEPAGERVEPSAPREGESTTPGFGGDMGSVEGATGGVDQKRPPVQP